MGRVILEALVLVLFVVVTNGWGKPIEMYVLPPKTNMTDWKNNHEWVDVSPIQKLGKFPATWMSQEVSKKLGSVGYNPNIPHL